MGDHTDLPFKAEYAKSSRSSCKACKGGITQDSLRLAVMVQVCITINKFVLMCAEKIYPSIPPTDVQSIYFE